MELRPQTVRVFHDTGRAAVDRHVGLEAIRVVECAQLRRDGRILLEDERPRADAHAAALDLPGHTAPRGLGDLACGGQRDAPLLCLIDQRARQQMARPLLHGAGGAEDIVLR